MLLLLQQTDSGHSLLPQVNSLRAAVGLAVISLSSSNQFLTFNNEKPFVHVQGFVRGEKRLQRMNP
jgi:hypothetical protein